MIPKAVMLITVALLLIGALPLPYGYYTLLSIVACVVFCWSAFVTFEQKHEVYPWILALLAVLFNPIIEVHLTKAVWSVIDIGAGLFLLALYNQLTIHHNKDAI